MITQLVRLDTDTIASAGELLFDSEVDPDKIKTTAGALAKAVQWLERLTEGVDDKKEALKRVSRASVRAWCVPQLREYLDQKETVSHGELIAGVNQWKNIKKDGRSEFLKRASKSGSSPVKRGVSCYLCGRMGHFARDSKKKGEGESHQAQGIKPEWKKVKCYGCGEEGHKKLDCPKAKSKTVKRVERQHESVQTLRGNELLAKVEGYSIPMTIDSGAEISVIPKELVDVVKYTGRTEVIKSYAESDEPREVPVAEVTMEIGGHKVVREVALVDWNTLSWRGSFASKFNDTEDVSLYIELSKIRCSLRGNQLKYTPAGKSAGCEVREAVQWTGGGE